MNIASGTLSLILGFGIVILAIGGWIFVYYLMKNKVLEDSRIDKLVSLGQWVIASVAIVVTGYIVSDSFKEREQQIKELEFFDKYVSTVTQAAGIEQRWRLCEYFAEVSPKGEFKDAWVNYQSRIKKDYEDFIETQKQLDTLANKILIDSNDIYKYKALTQKVAKGNESLIPNKDNSRQVIPVVYIQILSETSRQDALNLVSKINSLGYQAPGIERIKKPINQDQNEIRYFRSTDEIYATTVQGILKEMKIESILRLLPSYANRVKEGTIEVWLK
jgi:hypothetical protein